MDTRVDISTYLWLDHNGDFAPTRHEFMLELFRDRVVQPSLRAIDAKITELERSKDPGAVFEREDLAVLFQSTVGSYILSVQSMWERALRTLLADRSVKYKSPELVPRLQKVPWAGNKDSLQKYFHELMGVPIEAFDSYEDLDLLQSFGNAIRHGDGDSAQKIHARCPNLWWGWFSPGEEIVAGPFRYTLPLDGQKHPSFDSITLKECVLTQMIQSVLWFWQDLEMMRCNSFKRKHHTVVAQLAHWVPNRLARTAQRVWSPDDKL